MKSEEAHIECLSVRLANVFADATEMGAGYRDLLPASEQAAWDEVSKTAIEEIAGDCDFDGTFGDTPVTAARDLASKASFAMKAQGRRPLMSRLLEALTESPLVTCKTGPLDPEKLAQERLERCRVLWNALRHMEIVVDALGSALTQRSQKVHLVAQVALEGGPLGHQGEIVDGVDRLSLADLERASGAISRPSVKQEFRDADGAPDRFAATSGVHIDGDSPVETERHSANAAAAMHPDNDGRLNARCDAEKPRITPRPCPICDRDVGPSMVKCAKEEVAGCIYCGFYGPDLGEDALRIIAWNAVVDAWNEGRESITGTGDQPVARRS